MEDLRNYIRASTVVNWVNDPFSLGAYSYRTVKTNEALKVLLTPEENTIYLAGEAFHDGEEIGTVGAALGSAHSAVTKIIQLKSLLQTYSE